jgi:hypothetical protein
MRWILALVLLCVSYGAYRGFDQTWAEHLYSRFDAFLGHFMDEKQVELEGLALLDRAQVLALLPMEKPFTWWRTNRAEVEYQLGTHPLIASAEVSPCAGMKLRCFRVLVHERVPSFLAALGDKIWLLGDDGGFIAPVPRHKVSEGVMLPSGRHAIWVKGIVSEQNAPEVVRSRIQYVRQIVDHIEPQIGHKVREVELREGGEAIIKLQGLELAAVFSGAGDSEFERIRDEALRLKRLLQEFGERAHRISQVDLAFNKVAVVKLFEEPKGK